MKRLHAGIVFLLIAFFGTGTVQAQTEKASVSCSSAHGVENSGRALPPELVKQVVQLPAGSTIQQKVYGQFHINDVARAIVQNVREQEISAGASLGKSLSHKTVDLKNETDILLFFWRKDLESIKAKGFLNQHQSGKSQGTYSPEIRTKAEDRFTGLNLGDGIVSKEIRPKSAFLNIRSKVELARKLHGIDTQYGDIAAVLKPEVKQRSMWTSGDSLGLGGSSYHDLTSREMLEHRGTFDRGSLPDQCSYCPAYYEAVIYGKLDLNDVDYFLTNNDRASSELMTLGKPIYRYRKVQLLDRIVFEKASLVYDGGARATAPTAAPMSPKSFISNEELVLGLNSTGRYAPIQAVQRGYIVRDTYELSLVQTTSYVLQVYTPTAWARNFRPNFYELSNSLQHLAARGFRTKPILEITDKYVVQDVISLDRELSNVHPAHRVFVLNALKQLILSLAQQGLYLKGLGPSNLMLGLDGGLIIRGTDGLRGFSSVGETLEKYQEKVRMHWENYFDESSLRDLESSIFYMRSHYPRGRAS